MTLYAVTATVSYEYHEDDHFRNVRRRRSTPTFFLDSDVQGFTDIKGAKVIARSILDGCGVCEVEQLQVFVATRQLEE